MGRAEERIDGYVPEHLWEKAVPRRRCWIGRPTRSPEGCPSSRVQVSTLGGGLQLRARVHCSRNGSIGRINGDSPRPILVSPVGPTSSIASVPPSAAHHRPSPLSSPPPTAATARHRSRHLFLRPPSVRRRRSAPFRTISIRLPVRVKSQLFVDPDPSSPNGRFSPTRTAGSEPTIPPGPNPSLSPDPHQTVSPARTLLDRLVGTGRLHLVRDNPPTNEVRVT